MTDRTHLPCDGRAAFRDNKHTLSDEKNLYGLAILKESELIAQSNKLGESLKKHKEEKESWQGRRTPNILPEQYVSLRDVRKDRISGSPSGSRSHSRPSHGEYGNISNKENYINLNDRYINSQRGPSGSPEGKTEAMSSQYVHTKSGSHSQEPIIHSHSSLPIDHYKLRTRQLAPTVRQPPLAPPSRESVLSSGRFNRNQGNKSPYRELNNGSPLRMKTSETEYLQQVIDELVQKNDLLKSEVSDANVRQAHTQNKLDKAKSMINDLKTLQNDIKSLKERTTEAEVSAPELEQLKEEKIELEKKLKKALSDKEKYHKQATKLKIISSA